MKMNSLGMLILFLAMHLVLATPIRRISRKRNAHNRTRKLLLDGDLCDQTLTGTGQTFPKWLPYFMNLEADYKNTLHHIACKFNAECTTPTFASYQPSQDSPKARCAREYIEKTMETLEKYLDTFLSMSHCITPMEKDLAELNNMLTNDLHDTIELQAPRFRVIETGRNRCQMQVSSLYEVYVNSLRDFGSFLTNVIGMLKLE